MDTNCFEVKWERGVARGIFSQIALINHSCVPNCRKYFDAQRILHIHSSEALEPGQELSISYTNPLFCTTMRQVKTIPYLGIIQILRNQYSGIF